MSNLFLVCGIGGGGKTFLSRRMKELNDYIDVLLDSDEYYAKINGDERIRENTFDVWHTLYKDIHSYEMRGKNIIVSTNSLYVAQRRQFIEWFPTFDHHIIWVTSPWEKCLEGNKNRRRNIPEDILRHQWETMEFPNANEAGWATITHVTNCWDNNRYILFKLKGNVDSLVRFQ